MTNGKGRVSSVDEVLESNSDCVNVEALSM